VLAAVSARSVSSAVRCLAISRLGLCCIIMPSSALPTFAILL
jgi:hypothetical protein